MANVITLDFRNAPPASGGGTDHVAPGKYMVTIAKGERGTTAKGAPMVTLRYTIARGSETGKRLSDRFPFPLTAEDSNFGQQKLHAALLAAGIKVPTDKAFKLDIDKILGKQLAVEVGDNSYKDKNGNERINSQINDYILPGSQRPAPAPADDDEGDDDDESDESDDDEAEEADDDDTDTDDDDEAEEEEEVEEEEEAPPPPPVAKKKKAAPVAEAAAPVAKKKKAPAEAAVEDDSDEFPF